MSHPGDEPGNITNSGIRDRGIELRLKRKLELMRSAGGPRLYPPMASRPHLGWLGDISVPVTGASIRHKRHRRELCLQASVMSLACRHRPSAGTGPSSGKAPASGHAAHQPAIHASHSYLQTRCRSPAFSPQPQEAGRGPIIRGSPSPGSSTLRTSSDETLKPCRRSVLPP